MNLKINIYLFLILFTNLINSTNILNNQNILVEYTEENEEQIKINLINIEFIKDNKEEGPSTERNEGNLVEIIIKINGILNEEDQLYLVQSVGYKYRNPASLCNSRRINDKRIYTNNDIKINEDKDKIIYLNEKVNYEYRFGLDICLRNEAKYKALVKIRPVFNGLIEINIRDENGNDLNSNNVLQTLRPGSQHPHSTIKLSGIEAILTESIKNLGSAARPFSRVSTNSDKLTKFNLFLNPKWKNNEISKNIFNNLKLNEIGGKNPINPFLEICFKFNEIGEYFIYIFNYSLSERIFKFFVKVEDTNKEKCLRKIFVNNYQIEILQELDECIHIEVLKTKNKKHKDGNMLIVKGINYKLDNNFIYNVSIQPMFELKNEE